MRLELRVVDPGPSAAPVALQQLPELLAVVIARGEPFQDTPVRTDQNVKWELE